jgi:hypothetical protein
MRERERERRGDTLTPVGATLEIINAAPPDALG